MTGPTPAASGALHRWGQQLAAWQIPAPILAAATESPWALARPVFVARARGQLATASGVSYRQALAALPAGGEVLDVGAGAGAACLALSARAGCITAVDTDEPLLESLRELATGLGPALRTVSGRWPDVAATVPEADVVVCHHVLYNVAALEPFVAALTGHARRRVVVEISAQHPAAPWNPLWKRLHGVDRPAGPTAADAVAAIAELGLAPRWRAWRRPAAVDSLSYPELVATTCRRLCLPADRSAEVDRELRDLGAGPHRPYLGGPDRELVTLWWSGSAG